VDQEIYRANAILENPEENVNQRKLTGLTSGPWNGVLGGWSGIADKIFSCLIKGNLAASAPTSKPKPL
jgi:hypothetical protein